MTDFFGSFQLTSVGKLPNVTVAYPGEHWSDGKAGVLITPGQLVVPGGSAVTQTFRSLNSTKIWTVAASGALDPRACLALRPISVPDINPGSEYNPQLTPNDISNLAMAVGAYVHTYRSGAFHLTLIVADSSYTPGDLLGWDPAATPQGGKPAVGAWKKVNGNPTYALMEVEQWRPLTSDNTQGVLSAKTLRVQD